MKLLYLILLMLFLGSCQFDSKHILTKVCKNGKCHYENVEVRD